jgi:hypothetical protein
MLEILQFIFQDFWHFAGTIILVGVSGSALADVIYSFRK